ncbi:RlmE family RNA methyltransferase [Methanogenium marinum]|uniref:Ribosomal RNA large subunit methyltransferase E n=1 Tax=Methanogenium marinum TaxID=348610 RepID=A0A9Q4KMN7_9EURY|nr:RlmE family RNA methyltransferase [Methanogenium marinum]MDE4907263.1 RlmE family RNA methyltransferase [Methanogenium marinum]
MGSQWGRDSYYRKARAEGYRSRAAYKLLDIQERFHVIRDNDNVIDLGCAPGSWLQVLHELTEGQVIGIDLNPVPSLHGVISLAGDFTTKVMHEKVRSIMSGADISEANVIVCDASPNLSGNKSYDQSRSIGLSEEACDFVYEFLKPGGNFVVKTFHGDMFPEILERMRENFFGVKVYRSKAARKGSTEVYIIGKKFKGRRNSGDKNPEDNSLTPIKVIGFKRKLHDSEG